MSTEERINRFRARLVEVVNAAEMPAGVVLLVLENLQWQLRAMCAQQASADRAPTRRAEAPGEGPGRDKGAEQP